MTPRRLLGFAAAVLLPALLILAWAAAPDAPSYGCPMHPDTRSGAAGVCPRCGMALILMGPPGEAPYRVAIESSPATLAPGQPARLRFVITHPVSGARVTDLAIVHEMPFHLFIVSDDLAYYDHVHPAQDEDGGFVIDTSLPNPGGYHVYCDFVPIGGTPQVVHRHLVVSGLPAGGGSRPAKLVPDLTLVKTVDGIRFDLSLEPPTLAAGRAAALMYRLTDERTGAPVTDLEPYLGAWGHTLILSEDAEHSLHSHPTKMIPADADRASMSGGPDVAFNATIREPGVHRLWSQFKRAGRVTTVSFTIDVAKVGYVAAWRGASWSQLEAPSSAGPDGPVRAVAVRGGEVFAGGDFQTAGGVSAPGIARWDGRRWRPLGAGVDGTVRAIAVVGHDVFVGGEFTQAGGQASRAIARWDGARFWPLGTGLAGSRDAVRPTAVYAIAVRGKDVYIGGRFVTAGGETANGIARWDGTRFSTLHGGVESDRFDGIVLAMAFFRGDLYVGGQFLTAGGVAARNIARWDGNAFSPLGAGVAGGLERVAALAASGDRLFVGGDFTMAGDAPAGHLATWDGAAWHPSGLRTAESVRAIAAGGSALYVTGGAFTAEDGAKAGGIVQWDGHGWSAVAGGLGGGAFLSPVLAIAPAGPALYAGGGPFVAR
jgi:Heavy metal binding domain